MTGSYEQVGHDEGGQAIAFDAAACSGRVGTL